MKKKAKPIKITVDLPQLTPEQLNPFLEFLAQKIADDIIAEESREAEQSGSGDVQSQNGLPK